LTGACALQHTVTLINRFVDARPAFWNDISFQRRLDLTAR